MKEEESPNKKINITSGNDTTIVGDVAGRDIIKNVTTVIQNHQGIVIVAIIAIVGIVVFSIASQISQKSLPHIRLENWAVLEFQPNECGQLQRILVQATVSNTGGTSISLINASSSTTSESILRPTLSPSAISTSIAAIKGTPQIRFEPGKSESQITINGSCIIIQLPELNTEQATRLIKQTGLFEIQPDFCVGNQCYLVKSDQQFPIVILSGKSSSPRRLQDVQETKSELPIVIAPGEAKVIDIIWNPDLYISKHYTQLDVLLEFNDGNSLVIPLLDKISKNP